MRSNLGPIDLTMPNVGRRCSRPLCNRVADVILLFDYGASHVTLDWTVLEHDPNHLELCLEHAEVFGPPKGWTLDDRRGDVMSVTELDGDVETVPG